MSLRLALGALVFSLGCASVASPRPVPTAKLRDLDDDVMSDDAVRVASARACPKITRPRLWRVERDGKTSHLFGTYHIGVGADRLPDAVIDVFMAATAVAFESTDDDDDASGDGALPDPTAGTLRDELDADAWARLAAVLGDDLAPALSEMGATDVIALLGILYLDRDARLDDELERAARRLDKPVHALETGAELAVPIHRWLGVRTLRAVARSLDGRRAMRDRALQGLADYCTGRDRGEAFDARDFDLGFTREDLRAMEEDLLLGRNRAWLPRVEALLAGGGAFIAVGAAHLRGDGSVVELLRARGYEVTRVEAR